MNFTGNARIQFSRFKIGKKVLTKVKIEKYLLYFKPFSEFNKFKQRLKSPKNQFQLSAGLNIGKLNTILSETNHN